MVRNRKRYQRKLEVGTLASLLVLAAVGATVACGFVGIKNAHVKRNDSRRQMEDEIRVLEREVDSIALRVTSAHDRQQLARMLGEMESDLIPIESSESLAGMPQLPVGLALSEGPDPHFDSSDLPPPSG